MEKTEALVIRVTDFSETSRVVTLFTRDVGKLSALAKGGRRLKGPFEAALDLLARCQIVFLRKSTASLDLLTEARLLSRFRPEGRHLEGLYGGYYVAELLGGVTEEYDPHELLYDEAVRALDHLASGGDVRLPLLRFELATLREIGQFPVLDVCVTCGLPVTGDGRFAFWASGGGLICSRCQKPEYRNQSIEAETARLLRQLAELAEHEPEPEVPAERLAEMRRVMTPAICHVLERRPKMLKYLPL